MEIILVVLGIIFIFAAFIIGTDSPGGAIMLIILGFALIFVYFNNYAKENEKRINNIEQNVGKSIIINHDTVQIVRYYNGKYRLSNNLTIWVSDTTKFKIIK